MTKAIIKHVDKDDWSKQLKDRRERFEKREGKPNNLCGFQHMFRLGAIHHILLFLFNPSI